MLAPLDLVSAETGSKPKGKGPTSPSRPSSGAAANALPNKYRHAECRRHLASSSLTRQAALKLFDAVEKGLDGRCEH